MIETVEFSGTELGPLVRDRLRDLLELTGKACFPRRAAEGALTIRQEFGRRGYQAEVEYKASLNEDGTAKVRYRISPGERLIVRGAEIVNQGNEPLRTRRGSRSAVQSSHRSLTLRSGLQSGEALRRRFPLDVPFRGSLELLNILST